MSRAFVKEPEGPNVEDTPERPLSPHPNYVTPASLEHRRTRLHSTEQRLSTLPAEALDTASQRAALQRELRWLQARISSAIVIDPATQPRDRVAFGAEVTLAEVDSGLQRRYHIVGEDEADPEQGRISWASPLAQALLDAQIGEIVTWQRPAGDLDVEVLTIEYPVA